MKGGVIQNDRQKIKNLRRTLSSLRSERVARACTRACATPTRHAARG
nr:MAG TPA: hypothetical protein [Caudoviricetes sp.]